MQTFFDPVQNLKRSMAGEEEMLPAEGMRMVLHQFMAAMHRLGLREVPGLKKRPSTSELLDWLKVLEAEGIEDEVVENASQGGMPPLFGALLKSEEDVAAVRHMGNRHGRRRGR